MENNILILENQEEDIRVEYEIINQNEQRYSGEYGSLRKENDAIIKELDGKIADCEIKLADIESNIERLTNHADKLDYAVAVGCGVLTGLLDHLLVGAPDIEAGEQWSNDVVNSFVEKCARDDGYTGNGGLEGSIRFLENKYGLASDHSFEGQGMKIWTGSHHLDDFAHHPSPLGLMFSLIMQFTGNAYFANSSGEFFSVAANGDLIGGTIGEKLLAGTTNWFMHLVSDMAGSSSTAGAGMGIPGPILSTLKEISSLPGINQTEFSRGISYAYLKDGFDLRKEMALFHVSRLSKQVWPVVLNEVLVCSFYSLRQFLREYKAKGSIKDVNWKNILPYRTRTCVRMLTIATGTFTAVDMTCAAVKAGAKTGGEPASMLVNFFLNINIVGFGRFVVAIGHDFYMGYQRRKYIEQRIRTKQEILALTSCKVYYAQCNMWVSAKESQEALEAVYMDTSRLFEEYGRRIKDIAIKDVGIGDKLADIEKTGRSNREKLKKLKSKGL